ncbi:MAG TPA: hypothetical protein VGJ88_07395 [Thermoanaerobaculia bacterium]
MRIVIQQVQAKTASGDYEEFYAFRDSMVELLEALDSRPAVEPVAAARPALHMKSGEADGKGERTSPPLGRATARLTPRMSGRAVRSPSATSCAKPVGPRPTLIEIMAVLCVT